MKILIAADSFKDALPAIEVCQAIERGIRQANANIETILFPLGDGGEGTSEILTFHAQGKWIKLQVSDPLLRPVEAGYGISADGRTAFMEMAQAAGLQLLAPEERNPLHTNTYGVGEMIQDAVQRGVSELVLCIGGSATNDAGIGMAKALGYEFIDHVGLTIDHPTGASLSSIKRIDNSNLKVSFLLNDPKPPNPLHTIVLCDVNNPLYGKRGAAHVYARQKGADAEAIAQLDKGLRNIAQVFKEHFGRDVAQVPGAGAAGGLGAGAMAFLNATLKPGIETVLELTHFEEKLSNMDLLITGEGKIDSQTLHGKLISGIVKRAQGLPVIALCGTLSATPEEIKKLGLRAAFSILNRPMSLAEALASTAELLEQTAFNVVKTLEYSVQNF